MALSRPTHQRVTRAVSPSHKEGKIKESMDYKLRTLKCPFCNRPIPSSKEWITVCNNCKMHLELIWNNEKVVSIRRAIYPPSHYLNGSPNELLQTFIECIEKDMALEEWGFNKVLRLPNDKQGFAVIYDSEHCRVKFLLHGSDYGPVFASSIYYGRLHAADQEPFINWNGEKCRCWHSGSNILTLTLPFFEAMSPSEIAMQKVDFWQSREKSFGVDHPSSDYIEYPLKLHSKIWERYGKNLFNLFDLRHPELWEEYSTFSDAYNQAWYKRWNMTHNIEKFC